MMKLSIRHLLLLCPLALLIVCVRSSGAQFLFTYEINQEDESSRAPKSSLFDPSSFKIVTPSQLQSSYQKISAQLDSAANHHQHQQQSEPAVPAATSGPIESLSTQLSHQNANQPQINISPSPAAREPTSSGASGSSSAGLLKQTSAAIQSFAELFNLGPSAAPSSSPLASAGGAAPQVAAQPQVVDQQAEARSLHEHWTQQQMKAHPATQLHPHQQHHQQLTAASQNPALNSFTTSQPTNAGSQQQQSHQFVHQFQTDQQQQHPNPNPNPHHHQHHHQPQQVSSQQQQQQQPSQASYWLTASPLNSPDGNYLVAIKQPQHQAAASTDSSHTLQSLHHNQQQQQQHHQHLPESSIYRSPAAPVPFPVGRAAAAKPKAAPQQFVVAATPQPVSHHGNHATSAVTESAAMRAAGRGNLAQASFLSTPTSYYPPPSVQASSSGGETQPRPSLAQRSVNPVPPPQSLTEPYASPPVEPAQVQHKMQHKFQQTVAPAELPAQAQLRPPVNLPENFGPTALVSNGAPAAAVQHKSAEATLISFRQQQQQQHDQQNALFTSSQQHLAASQDAANPPSHPASDTNSNNNDYDDNNNSQEYMQPRERVQTPAPTPSPRTKYTMTMQRQQPAQQPSAQGKQHPLGEIPKVSPQIYESFLLQQRDQHEKHMELLKQQLELNKLLEEKQRKQKQQQQDESEKELKRKRKLKDEQERESAAKKAAKKAAAIKEQEAARKWRLEQEERELRRKREEAERKRAEERKYREYLEAREKAEREAAEARKRAAEEEEAAAEQAARELKLKAEREAQEEQVRRAEAEQRELKQRRAKEEAELQDAKNYQTYLRQQEDLKKLLELKQMEDEAQQQRRRQAASSTTTTTSTVASVQHQQSHRSGQAARANRLAQELRDRVGSMKWGTPLRTRTSSQASGYNSNPLTTESSSLSSSSSSSSLNQGSVPSSLSGSIERDRDTTPATTTTTTSTTTQRSSARSQTERVAERPRRVVERKRGQKANSPIDEKLIRQKIPLYSGAGKYGLYRGSNDSISSDLAALLDSVVLPPAPSTTSAPASSSSSSSSSTTTTTSTSTSPTTAFPYDQPTSTSGSHGRRQTTSSTTTTSSYMTDGYAGSSSLSPLLHSANSAGRSVATSDLNAHEPVFDDDVPRRPARGLSASTGAQRSAAHSSGDISSTRRNVASASAQVSKPTPSQRHFANETTSSTPASSSRSSATGSSGGAHIGLASLPADSDNDGIPGRAGVEYPVLAAVPPTSFSCSKQPLNGYYADTETACQVVHLCQGGVQSSILCPNGTIFNQEKFSCQWWYEVNCSRAPIFYQLNDNLYKAAHPSSTNSKEGRGKNADDNSDDDDGDNEENERQMKRKERFRREKAAQANLLSTASAST